MTQTRRVAVREFVDEEDGRMAHERRIEIKFPECGAVILDCAKR
jgi:hypothetical protein